LFLFFPSIQLKQELRRYLAKGYLEIPNLNLNGRPSWRMSLITEGGVGPGDLAWVVRITQPGEQKVLQEVGGVHSRDLGIRALWRSIHAEGISIRLFGRTEHRPYGVVVYSVWLMLSGRSFPVMVHPDL
jgi:hypothetical protein